MTKLLSILFSTTLLMGCSSTSFPTMFDSAPDNGRTLSGGEIHGTTSSFYWLNGGTSSPDEAADYVTSINGSWYQTSYHWTNGVLREVMRKGQAFDKALPLKSISTHIRYSSDGEAVYQRNKLDGKVIPLKKSNINRYAQDAEYLVDQIEDAEDDGVSLIQGVWNDGEFVSCQNKHFKQLKFNETALPMAIINRINGLNSYAGFLGKVDYDKNKVIVEELILLDKKSKRQCIKPESLLVE